MIVGTNKHGTIERRNEEGQKHRTDGPAVEYTDGTKHWYIRDQRHRTDGPAIEHANGSKYWYIRGKRHRTDGPAVEYVSGSKQWYIRGQLHRTDGPAVEWADGDKEWWVDGEQLTEEEFNKWKKTQRKDSFENIRSEKYSYFLAVVGSSDE
jgi:hypothetical protein